MVTVPTHNDDEVGHLAPELLESLLASSADAFYVVDPDGRVQFANPAAIATLGYADEAELLGRPSHATIHHKRPDGSPFPDAECPLLRPRTTGEVVRVDLDWFVRRDGSMVPIAYSSSPLETDHGRGAVVVFRQVDPATAEHDGAPHGWALELHESRARIVAAADAARRRIGRDLHDGAQQRLIGVLVTLRSAARRVGDGAGDAAGLLQRAADEVQAAIGDLRDLVAGVHPAILTDRGLRAAIESLAARSPVPIEVDVPRHRWPVEVEATAYFVVAEALTNVAKHAPDADHASVRLCASRERLVVEVEDRGPGGLDPSAGTGLRGLRDRVAAIGGTLEAGDAPGGGSRV
ncbi:sensor histidine kinase, partial [Patulibacter medicamentivorans]|uniref:sensor histidine kinase n=1 Tax=Patulibacter medicamentivorans TaxID=1097667 RepID=UPI001FCACBD9